MKIQVTVSPLISGAPLLGTFTMSDLLLFSREKSVSGIAVAKDSGREFDLAILEGDPEGAIFTDEKGSLYGDQAVLLISGNEIFKLYFVNAELVKEVVMGCRIQTNGHLSHKMNAIPEVGKKSEGLGILTLIIRRDNKPQNGMRVSIRNKGRIVGSDITIQDGSVGFKLLYGTYDCIVQDRNQTITSFKIQFHDDGEKITLDM
jgi:hypothetical protein